MNGAWIFGYGSIMWNPGFPYKTKKTCFIRGWERRFWQASSDHRGTPSFPGRVATLIQKKYSRFWGVAYNIHQQDENETLQSLDIREKNGYERTAVIATSLLGSSFDCLTYVAGPSNRHYLKGEPLTSIARQIEIARGPSGTNAEYITLMVQELRKLGVYDQHVEAIWKKLGGEGRGQNL